MTARLAFPREFVLPYLSSVVLQLLSGHCPESLKDRDVPSIKNVTGRSTWGRILMGGLNDTSRLLLNFSR
jgi:hypothetical protein